MSSVWPLWRHNHMHPGGGVHSHSGGDTYVLKAIKTPIFSIALTQRPHIVFTISPKDYIFFHKIVCCHPKPPFFRKKWILTRSHPIPPLFSLRSQSMPMGSKVSALHLYPFHIDVPPPPPWGMERMSTFDLMSASSASAGMLSGSAALPFFSCLVTLWISC